MSEPDPGVALVTGATSGIGAAFARRLAGQGYRLVITGRRRQQIDALSEELRGISGTGVQVVIAELSGEEAQRTLADRIRQMPPLRVLVNNAGFGTDRHFHEEDIDVQEAMVGVHVLAAMRLTHAAIPGMLAQGTGTIINVSSLGAFLPLPGAAVYKGTKAFLCAFSQSLHLELGPRGIRVQALCPGFTKTAFHSRLGMEPAQQRSRGIITWMSPEKVVDISLRHLARGKVICIPGACNKMLALLPWLLPSRLYYRLATRSGDRLDHASSPAKRGR